MRNSVIGDGLLVDQFMQEVNPKGEYAAPGRDRRLFLKELSRRISASSGKGQFEVRTCFSKGTSQDQLVQKSLSNGDAVVLGSTRSTETGEDGVFGYIRFEGTGYQFLDSREAFPFLASISYLNASLEYVVGDICWYLAVVPSLSDRPLVLLDAGVSARTPEANIMAATALADNKVIRGEEVVLRMSPDDFGRLCDRRVLGSDEYLLGSGTSVVPGTVIGDVCSSLDEADSSDHPILVTGSISPQELSQINRFAAVVLTSGGTSSHAAILAKMHCIPCVSGFDGSLTGVKRAVVDATSGGVYTVQAESSIDVPDTAVQVSRVVSWARKHFSDRVAVNADSAQQINAAKRHGVRGVGLLRTEHLIHQDYRLHFGLVLLVMMSACRGEFSDEMVEAVIRGYASVLSDVYLECLEAAATGSKRAPRMDYVTIRLLDPPSHEFLPKSGSVDREALDDLFNAWWEGGRVDDIQYPSEEVLQDTSYLEETNPMMGVRGSRIAFLYPEVYEAQYRALVLALGKLREPLSVRLMFPFVSEPEEFHLMRSEWEEAVSEFSVFDQDNRDMFQENLAAVQVGVMVEIPSLCYGVRKLFPGADFLSIGSNDLTQAAHLMSRDDCARLVSLYSSRGYFKNPFLEISDSVGELIRVVLEQSEGIPVTLCGDHATQVSSAHSFLDWGGSGVSVPLSALPATQVSVAQWGFEKKNREER